MGWEPCGRGQPRNTEAQPGNDCFLVESSGPQILILCWELCWPICSAPSRTLLCMLEGCCQMVGLFQPLECTGSEGWNLHVAWRTQKEARVLGDAFLPWCRCSLCWLWGVSVLPLWGYTFALLMRKNLGTKIIIRIGKWIWNRKNEH